jgi:hypothetical protein
MKYTMPAIENAKYLVEGMFGKLEPLTVQKMDKHHLQYVVRKYIEEYGLQDGSQAVDEVLSQWANQWGINYGNEMKASN